jgi:hypothetical protein
MEQQYIEETLILKEDKKLSHPQGLLLQDEGLLLLSMGSVVLGLLGVIMHKQDS